ncbi:hypothetical protein AQUCO_00900821v1 [Aquilegia coerulea]|uniref:SHSP domain-containing protein n=1 Tax=Aquilegia coerulea TaxID=218851 RepID=A0A2G5EFJ9_AQUCA|nr:hypothetical protein AQUCO_00900821v1 [Aquilegia coerulea]
MDTSSFTNAQIDWKETPEAHVIQTDVPGMKKEEVKIEVEGKVIQICGERNVEKVDEKDKWHRVERRSGKFIRRFQMPENANLDAVNATMENGVLTITIPKEEKMPEVKAIQISG